MVRHAETIKLFVGDLDRNEVESFCDKEQASPQVGGTSRCNFAGKIPTWHPDLTPRSVQC